MTQNENGILDIEKFVWKLWSGKCEENYTCNAEE